ncbi:MAG: glutamate--tRNA ligase [Pseudomonadota bacterium]
MTVRTRFAPSPTGFLHVGGVRTALFSWLYARKMGGEFILRIEDSDRERSTQEYLEAILDSMDWLGMDYDEGPYYQSRRFDRYQEVIQQLLDEGKAYRCYCTREELQALRAGRIQRKQKPRYDGRYRDYTGSPRQGVEPVIRFKNPLEGGVLVDDLVRGRVVFDNAELDDLIIARADGSPTYNFTVVVDDMDMRLTHVIRGDDHLNNTPRQINIFKALGTEPPRYAHIPMILGADGKKLSKRHGAMNVMQYREQGYLPQALLNYLVRLGWSHGDQEVFSAEEMIRLFDIKDINSSASSFNPEKLLWLNQYYLKESDYSHCAQDLRWQMDELSIDLEDGPDLEQLFEVQKARTKTLNGMARQSQIFFQDYTEYASKAKKHLKGDAIDTLKELLAALETVSDWKKEPLHDAVKRVAQSRGLKMGKVAQPLRVALTGGLVSPSIDLTMELLGRIPVLKRIDRTIQAIASGGIV